MGASREAEACLVAAIKDTSDPLLIAYYATYDSAKKSKQMALFESALSKHPANAQLLCAIGQWHARQRLWGKAVGYLTQSLAVDPQQFTAGFVLGHVFLALGR